MMHKSFLLLFAVAVLAGCGTGLQPEDENDITSRFKTTWNIYEKIEHNDDGSITYHALPWGGLVGGMKEHNMPVDWSTFESIRFDFAEPTKVGTQIMISDKLRTYGKAGITSLTCYFDGQRVNNISEVALQASDTTVLTVKRVYLTPSVSRWESTKIWEGDCKQGNWVSGFVIKPEKFTTAYEGDKLEIVFHTDTSDPAVSFWQLKTIYSGTDQTLEGNSNELNDWGCAMVGREATSYRIILTSKDITALRKYGVFINGFYNNVTQCNLLRKVYSEQ